MRNADGDPGETDVIRPGSEIPPCADAMMGGFVGLIGAVTVDVFSSCRFGGYCISKGELGEVWVSGG